MSNDPKADKQAIRETVENWVAWRDAGDWERFATLPGLRGPAVEKLYAEGKAWLAEPAKLWSP